MAATARDGRQLEIDARALKDYCSQILPDLKFIRDERLLGYAIDKVWDGIARTNDDIVYAKGSLHHIEYSPSPEERSPHVSAGSATSAGSTSTQQYESKWDEQVISIPVKHFIETRDALNKLLTRRDEWQNLYNEAWTLNEHANAMKADLYNRAKANWNAFIQTQPFYELHFAEEAKNDRLMRAERLGQEIDRALPDMARDLLATKQSLLELIAAIPVPVYDLSEKMRAAIHNVQLTKIPLVENVLLEQAPSWIDRIGYEMGHAFGIYWTSHCLLPAHFISLMQEYILVETCFQ